MKIEELQRLAGIKKEDHSLGHEISHRGTQLSNYAKKHKIRPGDPDWFKLWFARPHLTGENPTPKLGKSARKDA